MGSERGVYVIQSGQHPLAELRAGGGGWRGSPVSGLGRPNAGSWPPMRWRSCATRRRPRCTSGSAILIGPPLPATMLGGAGAEGAGPREEQEWDAQTSADEDPLGWSPGGFPVRRWRAACCCSADGACVGPQLWWWTRACAHAFSASCPPLPTSGRGSSSRRCRAAGSSRRGGGSTAPRGQLQRAAPSWPQRAEQPGRSDRRQSATGVGRHREHRALHPRGRSLLHHRRVDRPGEHVPRRSDRKAGRPGVSHLRPASFSSEPETRPPRGFIAGNAVEKRAVARSPRRLASCT